MKLYIYANDIEQVIEGRFFLSLRITDDKEWHDKRGCPYLGEVEVDLDIDNQKLTQIAVDAIRRVGNETRAEFSEKLRILDEKKQSLLAITHVSAA